MRQFNTRIVPYTDTDDERLNFLEQYTSGDVNKIVQSFSYLDTTIGYQSALRELEDRYGDNEIIATAFINKALNWPQIKPNDAKSMDDLSVFLAECNNAVRSIDSMRILEYPDNPRKLVSKLPFYLHDRWRNEVQQAKEKCTPIKFSDLVSFIKREAKKLNHPIYGKEAMAAQSSETPRKNVMAWIKSQTQKQFCGSERI